MGKKMLPIDSEKLRETLINECVSISEAGRSVGQSEKFFGNFIRKGEIPEYATYLLEGVLGIPYEVYARVEPVVDPNPEPAVQEDCDWCRVYRAVVQEVSIRFCPMCGKRIGGE